MIFLFQQLFFLIPPYISQTIEAFRSFFLELKLNPILICRFNINILVQKVIAFEKYLTLH